MFAPQSPDGQPAMSVDSWDGYRAARTRVFETAASIGAAHLVVLVDDHQVVRPLECGFHAGNSSTRLSRRTRGRGCDEMGLNGTKRNVDEQRDEQRATGRRLPGSAESAPSRRLMVCDEYDIV